MCRTTFTLNKNPNFSSSHCKIPFTPRARLPSDSFAISKATEGKSEKLAKRIFLACEKKKLFERKERRRNWEIHACLLACLFVCHIIELQTWKASSRAFKLRCEASEVGGVLSGSQSFFWGRNFLKHVQIMRKLLLNLRRFFLLSLPWIDSRQFSFYYFCPSRFQARRKRISFHSYERVGISRRLPISFYCLQHENGSSTRPPARPLCKNIK